MVAAELKVQLRLDVPSRLISHAWPRLTLTADIAPESLREFVRNAQQVGFLRSVPDLSHLVVSP